MIRHKLVRYDTKVLDAKTGRVEAVVSSESPDRQGDVIRQQGWDMKQFMRHPVLLASHDYYDLRSQIGEWEAMEVKGKQLVGTARYYVGEGNEQADWGFNLASKGRAAFSVGFIPDMDKAKKLEGDDGDDYFAHYEFCGQELLEVSHVTIPANADALQVIRSAKGLHPAIAEIVDETLRDLKAPTSITISSAFDSQGVALIDAIAERLAAALGKGLASSSSSGSPAPTGTASAEAGDTPKTRVVEVIDLVKEFWLP